MRIIRGLRNLPYNLTGTAVTIGNFDGIHTGHQHILSRLKQRANKRNLATILILMEPQPQEYFAGGNAPARLTRFREKIMQLQQSEIDYVVCLRFNQKLASKKAINFIVEELVTTLRMKFLMVGEDFRFGRDREGDVRLLSMQAPLLDYEMETIPTILAGGERISSTRVRELLWCGSLDKAAVILGRRYSICGRVVEGDRRGRQWGIPTANLFLHRQVSPIRGVYVVLVRGLDTKLHKGVANIGNRPTVDGSRSLLEVHIFDFAADIYGRYLEIIFIKKLRDEKQFDNIDLLKQQILRDVAMAKLYVVDNSNDRL